MKKVSWAEERKFYFSFRGKERKRAKTFLSLDSFTKINRPGGRATKVSDKLWNYDFFYFLFYLLRWTQTHSRNGLCFKWANLKKLRIQIEMSKGNENYENSWKNMNNFLTVNKFVKFWLVCFKHLNLNGVNLVDQFSTQTWREFGWRGLFAFESFLLKNRVCPDAQVCMQACASSFSV